MSAIGSSVPTRTEPPLADQPLAEGCIEVVRVSIVDAD
jgi:hypothetical protein